MTLGIPDEPTQTDVDRLLGHLVMASKIQWRMSSRYVKESTFTECLRWEDSFMEMRQEAMSTGCCFMLRQIRS